MKNWRSFAGSSKKAHLENSGSKAAVKKEHSELKLSGSFNQKPDGPPPMPPRLPLEPVLHTAPAGAITALAASPWAPLVAVAGQQQVLLYNTETLQLLGVLPFPEGIAHVLKFSRNGKLLLAGGGHEAKSGRVVLWDITTGKRITEIGDEYDVVLAADISPDQSLVALGGPSKVVRIFSTATGELVQQIKKHTDWIYSLEFSPDNVLLASGDRNGDVFVWEAAKGQEYLSLRGHTAGVTVAELARRRQHAGLGERRRQHSPVGNGKRQASENVERPRRRADACEFLPRREAADLRPRPSGETLDCRRQAARAKLCRWAKWRCGRQRRSITTASSPAIGPAKFASGTPPTASKSERFPPIRRCFPSGWSLRKRNWQSAPPSTNVCRRPQPFRPSR